jgi:transposase
MEETITMSAREQRRAWVLSRVEAEEMGVAEAAGLLGLTERSIRRLRVRMAAEGPAGLVHRNRGRASPRRLTQATRERILELVEETYFDVNDSHLADLLAEQEGIEVSRVTLRRLLRCAGRPPRRRRRTPQHRRRRDRMPKAGMLLQTDGSRHDWLGDRGPRLTLIGLIDDATGRVTAATFRDEEDSAGYLEVLATTLRRYGVPGAVYHDRAGIFEPHLRQPLTLEEQLIDSRVPTQLGRTFAELGIGSIAARSPQAKGRVERLWGTLQDRLIPELRIAGIDDRDGANAFLPGYLVRHNRRFTVPAAEPASAWRRLPRGTRLERVCCFKYRRTIARDGTVRAGATILQVPPRPNGRSRAGQEIELHVRLDGCMVIWDGERELLATPAPLGAAQLRALGHARVEVGHKPPSAATAAAPPSAAHPWRRITPGTKLATTIKAEREGRTESLNS